MKSLSWIVIVTMLLTGASIAPINVDAQTEKGWGKSWEDWINDMTGTGPTVPGKLHPGKMRAVDANMARALNENNDVRRINTDKYGRPKWNKGVWLEDAKGNLGIIPMGSSTSKPDVFPRRENHHALFLLSKRGSPEIGPEDPCVLIVTASAIQSSASARAQRSLTFSHANGEPFLRGNLSGNKWSFKRVGNRSQFTSRNCPQAFHDPPDGGIGECIEDYDIPDFWELPCGTVYWYACGAYIVYRCVRDNW